jgi:hypothetical protein
MASKRWSGYVSPLHAVTKANSDTSIPHCALVLAIKYPSMAAIDLALKSDVRNQSRLETQELVKMFDGRIFHTFFEAAHFNL